MVKACRNRFRYPASVARTCPRRHQSRRALCFATPHPPRRPLSPNISHDGEVSAAARCPPPGGSAFDSALRASPSATERTAHALLANRDGTNSFGPREQGTKTKLSNNQIGLMQHRPGDCRWRVRLDQFVFAYRHAEALLDRHCAGHQRCQRTKKTPRRNRFD